MDINFIYENFIMNMDFLNMYFYPILFVSIILFWIAPGKLRKGLLTLLGVMFYCVNGIYSLVIVVWLTVCAWLFGKYVGKSRFKLTLFIIIDIIPFVFVKAFSVSSFRTMFSIAEGSLIYSLLGIIGIAYTSLMSVGYVVDRYYERVDEEKLTNIFSVLVFFPYAICGPVEKVHSVSAQMSELKRKKFSIHILKIGFLRIFYGLFVKLVIADRIAILVNKVYDSPERYLGFEILAAVVGYGLQIYFDFSACSNIAIGIARCFDIKLIENFKYPYFSTSVSEFWRRWHISLSNWLKDYVYVPLGGNRKGTFRKYINLLVTFLVSGLWHGFSLNFIIWGALQGIYQIVGNVLREIKKKFNATNYSNEYTFFQRMACIAGTFILIDFSWIFFRINDFSKTKWVFLNLVNGFQTKFFTSGYLNLGLDQKEWNVLAISMIAAIVVDVIMHLHEEKVKEIFKRESVLVQWGIVFALFTITMVFGIYGKGYDASAFIYRGF